MVKFRKTVLAVLLGCFTAFVFVAVSIHLYYYSSLPGVPDEKAGRTHKMSVQHGFVRYGSEKEFRALQMIENCFPVATVLFLTAVVLGLKWGIFHIRDGREP